MTAPGKSVRLARLPLDGLRVLEPATLLAGPLVGMMLADFGADVVKIEHPRGDPLRSHGHAKHGIGLLWKVIGRNKRAVTLDLGRPQGQELFRRMAEEADVIIENFRPGTLERWGIGPDVLLARNPGLIILRTTGFGQTGPYAKRPAFGTLAESMSGFAHVTGDPDGPPTLPPFGLADGIAGLAGTSAVMFALYERDVHSGGGQVIDLAIYEPIMTVLGAQATVYDQLGVVQSRTGNRSINNAPRNTYLTRDGKWVAISTSAQSVAERVMRLVGQANVIDEPWFATGSGRAQHAEELDQAVGAWIGERDLAEVVRRFEEADAAVAPVYDIADLLADPQVRARETITTIDDEDLGRVRMQDVVFRLLGTPGRIRWAGRRLGQDNEMVYRQLGIGPDQLAALRTEDVI